jgi:hypothetical protein
MYNLLPCPFCGSIPEADFEGESGCLIECVNRECGVQPSVFCDHEPQFDANETAANNWNSRFSAYGEIVKERIRQDTKWGGPQHDDAHDLVDFNRYIHQRLLDSGIRKTYRQRMIEVAALAIAAIESYDRRPPTNDWCRICGFRCNKAYGCISCNMQKRGLSAPVPQNPEDRRAAVGRSDASGCWADKNKGDTK